jgi:hypothetical protein
METAIGQHAPQVVELSDENKEKVCLIADINKANLILLGKNITAQEFDHLYDSHINHIEICYLALRHMAERKLR